MSRDPQLEPPPQALAHPRADGMAPRSGLPVEVAAGLAEMFTLPGGIFFYCLDRKDPFVRFHAIQSIILGAIGLVVRVIAHLIILMLGQVPLLGEIFIKLASFVVDVFVFAWIAAYLACTIGAFLGKTWRLPWAPVPPARPVTAAPEAWHRPPPPPHPALKAGGAMLKGMARGATALYARYRKGR